jgi:hypothetical protein
MATVFFDSLETAEVIEVEFLTLKGGVETRKLLVDSGFTGKSAVILGKDATELAHAQIPGAHTVGALHGPQDRAWVTCRIPKLTFQSSLIAILTDVTSLSLPPGVRGMAGLTFLRQFARWGAERTGDRWRFFLSDGND